MMIYTIKLQSLTRFAFRLFRTLTRVPDFDESKVESLIDHEADENEKLSLKKDLQEVRKGKKSNIIFIIIAMSTVYVLRNLLVVMRTVLLFDYSDISTNFHFVPNQQSSSSSSAKEVPPLLQFACMTTNCTRLSENRSLFEVLSELPVFAICDPLAFLYPVPFIYLERAGLFLFLILGLVAFVDGFLIQIFQLISSNCNECCLFAQTPNLSIALTKQRLSSIASKFKPKESREQEERQHNGTSMGQLSISSVEEPSDRLRRDHLIKNLIESSPIEEVPFEVHQNHKGHQEGSIHTLDDITWLPVTRSSWFQRKLTELTCVMAFTGTIVILICTYFSYSWFINIRLSEKIIELEQIQKRMQQEKCAIWLTNESMLSSDSTLIDFASFHLEHKLLGIIESVGAQFLPTACAVLSFVLFHLTIVELNCFQAELQNQLLFLIEFKRLSRQEPFIKNYNIKRIKNSDQWSRHNVTRQKLALVLADLSMRELQKEFRIANDLTVYSMKTNLIRTKQSSGRSVKFNITSSKLDSTLAFQDLSLKVLRMIHQPTISSGQSQVDSNDVHRLLMRGIYLNFCLYLELMQHYTPSLGVIISIGYTLLYSLIVISIWYWSQISAGQLDGPLMTVGLVWFLTNYVLLVCSAVHAKGKSLHKLIWSLIAQFEGLKDSQMSHWIHLWQAQVIYLDSDNGIALKTLGFKVTYVKMVQLVIWAATSIVFVVQSTHTS